MFKFRRSLLLFIILITQFLYIVGCINKQTNTLPRTPETNYNEIFNFMLVEQLSSMIDGYIFYMSSAPNVRLSDLRSTYFYENGEVTLDLLLKNCTEKIYYFNISFLLDYEKTYVILANTPIDNITLKLEPGENTIITFKVDNLTDGFSHDFVVVNTYTQDDNPNADTFRYVMQPRNKKKVREFEFTQVQAFDIIDDNDSYTSYGLRYKKFDNISTYTVSLSNNTDKNINYSVVTFKGIFPAEKTKFITLSPHTRYDMELGEYIDPNIWALITENPFIALENDGKYIKNPSNIKSVLPMTSY